MIFFFSTVSEENGNRNIQKAFVFQQIISIIFVQYHLAMHQIFSLTDTAFSYSSLDRKAPKDCSLEGG